MKRTKIGKNIPDLPMAMGRSKKLGTGGGARHGSQPGGSCFCAAKCVNLTRH